MSNPIEPPMPSRVSNARAALPGAGIVPLAEGTRYVARLHTSLETVAPVWRRLQADGAATAYQRLDWTAAILRHLSGPARARPVLVELSEPGSDIPILLAPFALIRHRGYREVTWLDLGVCDYAAPLLAPGIDLSPEAMGAAWKEIRRALPKADVIRISRIPSEIQGRPNPLATLAGCRPMTMQASGVAIDGDPQTLLERLCRPSTRKDMGKTRRRLERQGEVRFTRGETPAEIDAIFDALVEQRRTRFAEIGRFDLLAQPHVEAFYRAEAHAGLNGGAARLFGLSVDGQWIAAAFGLVHGETFHGILLTMAGGVWRNTSPGLHIVAEALRWARSQDLTYFDFTVGVMPYKEDFGVHTRDLVELVESRSLRGTLVTALSNSAVTAKEWLREHPGWYKPLQGARRWMRRTFS